MNIPGAANSKTGGQVRSVFSTAVVVAALLFTTTTFAASAKWNEMSPKQKRFFLTQQIARDRTTVRWWLNHRPHLTRAVLDVSGLQFLAADFLSPVCSSIGVRAPNAVCTHANRMRHSLTVLRAVQAQIAESAWPEHHALWTCEHSHEASDWHNQNTGGNGHWGGLQMTKPWGAGVYYLADPADATQLQQERAAEAGYRASGYSHTWLLGQWYHPDCLAYA